MSQSSLQTSVPEPQFTWRLISAGTYWIGCDRYTERTAGRAPVVKDRLAIHTYRAVTISAFWLADFPVTNAQYEQFCPEHRRAHETPDDEHPVVDVAYHEAKLYCSSIGARLPSEIEWEIAARGSENLPCSNSPKIDRQQNNFYPSAGPNKRGDFPANDFGLYDMCGNIYEYTSTEERIADGRYVVVGKGGSWGTCKYGSMCAYFNYFDPGMRSNRCGFRVCRDAS